MAEGRIATGGAYRRSPATRRLDLVLAALVVSQAWMWWRPVAHIHEHTKLFAWIGVDFAQYHAQGQAVARGHPPAMYNAKALDAAYNRTVEAHSPVPHRKLTATHVPYPPLFAGAFSLLSRLPPIHGFALWTALNAALLGLLAWLAVRDLAGRHRAIAAVVLFTSFPFGYSLLVGQAQPLVSLAVAGCYLLWRADRQFLAGLCLGGALIKPHYALLLALVLALQRRWRALLGLALAALAILAGSLLVGGVETLRLYPTSFATMSTFHGDHPGHMINWRSLVILLWPDIGEGAGLWLSRALALGTVGLALVPWRRRLDPADPRFAAAVALLLVATLLASHHSHAYGASVVAVPAAAVALGAVAPTVTRVALVLAFVLPRFVFTLAAPGDVEKAAALLATLLVASFAALAWEALRRLEPARGARG